MEFQRPPAMHVDAGLRRGGGKSGIIDVVVINGVSERCTQHPDATIRDELNEAKTPEEGVKPCLTYAARVASARHVANYA